MSKIKIDKDLYQRAAQLAQEQGYSSVDELVEHLVERALQQHEDKEKQDQAAVEERLRGLGYID